MNNPCKNCEHAYKQPVKNGYYHRPSWESLCRKCERFAKYETYRESKRRYAKGVQIKSIQDFETHLSDNYMFLGDSIKHVSILENQRYRVLKSMLKNGCICMAILNDENKMKHIEKT